MQSKLKWWLCFVSVVSAPFAFTILTYELGLAIPGIINRACWEVAASIAFIGTAIPVAMLLDRSMLSSVIRTGLVCIAFPILLISAFVMQIHNTCGPTQKYIGQTDTTWRDSECGD
jgi:putative Ca2+/H+ antiporter (TMEM165/GDT1 family)